MKYTSIVISGPVASGTTTAAKAVAEKLNLEYHSAGDFFRKYMIEHNIPLHAHSQIPDEIDQKVDRELTTLADGGGVIIEGRYIGYFTRNMPHVLKVLLTADEKIRIKRATERIHTHTETAQDIKKREDENDAKFRKLYANENFLDPNFFDLVIDTTDLKPNKVTEQILRKFSTHSINLVSTLSNIEGSTGSNSKK